MKYAVTGFYYTDTAMDWLIEHEMADPNTKEVRTQPPEWDRYATPEHWNPDVFDIYMVDHTGDSVEAVWQQINHLPWYEAPEILPITSGVVEETNDLKTGERQ